MKKYGKFSTEMLDSLLVYVFFGVVLGGRLGYIFFYHPSYFLAHPDEIIAVWNGGMSFHGGFIGVLIAILIFSHVKKISFFSITDLLAVTVPIALGLGRIGNWINGELPGFAPYAGILPMNIGGVAHFPSPLFEMLLEGIMLFVVMIFFWKHRRAKTPGLLSSIFLIGYGTMRLIAEQFRLPDAHIGYLFGTSWLTLGMIYTLPILIAGIWLFVVKNPSDND